MRAKAIYINVLMALRDPRYWESYRASKQIPDGDG